MADDDRSLSRLLLERWCKGKRSAHEVVDEAAAAIRGNRNSADDLLRHLASINKHNAHRDVATVVRGLRSDSQPPLYYAELPLWSTDLGRQEQVLVPMALPHEWLDFFVARDPSMLTMTAEVAEEVRLWKERTRASETDQAIIPLSIWGDTAPFGHKGHDSIMLCLWSSLSGAQKRRWVALLPKTLMCQCGCSTLHTLDALWDVLAWSFRALAAGVYPTCDHRGRPFVGDDWRLAKAGQLMPYRGAVVMFRGDWPWLSTVFQVATHGSTHVCFLCGATTRSDECPFTDASLDAAWRGSLVSPVGWFEDRFRRGLYVSSVFSWPGFTLQNVVLDWMHMVDLGVAQACLGNILVELFRSAAVGGLFTNPTQGLTRLQTMLNDCAVQLGTAVPFSKMTLSMIRGEDNRPRLKLKAAKTKALAPIVLKVLETHFPPASDREQRRFSCLEFLVLSYQELDGWSASSAARLEELCRRHVLLYTSLAREAVSVEGVGDNWCSWRFYPKHHMLLHLTGEQIRRYGNPRLFWCYSDEGSIGIAVTLAESTHVRTLVQACWQKYLLFLHLE